MTSLEDGVRALLAEPACVRVRSQLVDRVQEDCADPRGELLRLVIAHPASDGPRLAYADFCELQGERGRAEFIRAQCEDARLEGQLRRTPGDHVHVTVPLYREMTRARKRWVELLQERPRPGERSWHGEGKFWKHVVARWERGFIGHVRLEAKHWVKHADAILAQQPVRDVQLTTLPEPEQYSYDDAGADLTLGRRTIRFSHEGVLGYNRSDPTVAGAWQNVFLPRFWPGVTFHLPPANDFASLNASIVTADATLLAFQQAVQQQIVNPLVEQHFPGMPPPQVTFGGG